MKSSLVCDYTHYDCKNIEIYNETIEANFQLDYCDERIKEILNISQEPKIISQYIYRAPIIKNCKTTYGYKVKVLIDSTTNIEYTEKSDLGQTKFTCKKHMYNIIMDLPCHYEEGMHVNVTPTVVHVSYKIISESDLYVSSFVSFAVTV